MAAAIRVRCRPSQSRHGRERRAELHQGTQPDCAEEFRCTDSPGGRQTQRRAADEAGQILSFTARMTTARCSPRRPRSPERTADVYAGRRRGGVANVTVRLSDTADGKRWCGRQHPELHDHGVRPATVALCQNVTVTATLIGTAVASVNAGSFDPDGGRSRWRTSSWAVPAGQPLGY